MKLPETEVEKAAEMVKVSFTRKGTELVPVMVVTVPELVVLGPAVLKLPLLVADHHLE